MWALTEELFERFLPCYGGIHYERGVVNSSFYKIDFERYLQDQPCGTYIIGGDSPDCCEVILKKD